VSRQHAWTGDEPLHLAGLERVIARREDEAIGGWPRVVVGASPRPVLAREKTGLDFAALALVFRRIRPHRPIPLRGACMVRKPQLNGG
jgi:hypothetical protein